MKIEFMIEVHIGLRVHHVLRQTKVDEAARRLHVSAAAAEFSTAFYREIVQWWDPNRDRARRSWRTGNDRQAQFQISHPEEKTVAVVGDWTVNERCRVFSLFSWKNNIMLSLFVQTRQHVKQTSTMTHFQSLFKKSSMTKWNNLVLCKNILGTCC